MKFTRLPGLQNYLTAHRGIWNALLVVGIGLGASLFTPAYLWGQAAESASIVGQVTDTSGAPVAGALVSLTGPALLVPKLTTTTDADGNYKFLDLPAPGVFVASFTRADFQKVDRSNIRLSVGFAARVDIVLPVGAVTQTVEVTAASPVVDTVNTAGSTTIGLEQLHATPLGTTLQEMLPLANGVAMQGKPDVGDSNLAARSMIVTYGVLLEPTLDLEGINLTTANNVDTGAYFDGFSIEEADFKTTGNNADVAFPGVDQEVVIRSGANQFHGEYQGAFESPEFQANNVTPALSAQGIKFTNPIQHFYEYAGDLGGRLVRDKLWFYFGYSKVSLSEGSLGFVNGPDKDGCWICGDAPPAPVISNEPGYNSKVDFQLTPKTKLIGVYMYANKLVNENGGSATTPLPSTTVQFAPDTLWKGEVQSTPTSHLLVDALAGLGGYHVVYTPQSGTAVAGNPSSQELSNKVFTGPNSLPTTRPQFRFESKGSVTFLPERKLLGGNHEFRFGTEETWENAETTYPKEYPSGDYLLLFNKGAPFEIQTYNIPVTPFNQLFSQSVYTTDTWSLRRFVINWGVRWERYHSFYPNEKKPAGQFSSAASVSGQSTLTWTDVVPRVGGAWDIKGNGKTVVKGSFGMFGDTMGDLFAGTYNEDGLVTTTYKWTGPCVVTSHTNVSYNEPNTSCDYSPGSVTFSPADSSNPAFVSAVGGVNELINLNLKQDRIYEYVARVERQVIPNLAVSAGYVRHVVYNLYNSYESTTNSTSGGVNIARPYSDYTVPVQFTDTLTGNPVTVWTYPAGVGGNQYQLQNAPSTRPDTYNSFDIAVTKKYSNKFNAYVAYWITKNHEWIQAIQPTPNDAQYPIDNTWNWEVRADVSYNLPLGFELSSYFRGQSGIWGQRTEVFSSSLLQQGSVTLRMEPFGAERGPFISVLSAKLTKKFTLKESRQLQVYGEGFNLLNSSAATSTSYLTSTFDRVTGVVSPLVGRVGADFTF
jgi:hypothetical protein